MEAKEKQKPLFVIVRGVPGTGKSTFAKQFLTWFRGIEMVYDKEPEPFHHLETDMFFTTPDGEYNFIGQKIGEAHMWCQNKTLDALAGGESVVVTNTFTTFNEITPYLDMARDLNISVSIVSLTDEYGNIHGVPEKTMTAMRERFISRNTLADLILQRYKVGVLVDNTNGILVDFESLYQDK